MASVTKKTTVEEFVTAYIQSETMDDVIAKTGLTKGSIQSKCSHLRKRGVQLPKKFVGERIGKTLDIDAINGLIDDLSHPATAAAKKHPKAR